MPTDSRRNQGPELTENYRLYVQEPVLTKKQMVDNVINEKGERQGGRTKNEMRKIYVKTGIVTQAKGSAYIELDKTKVLVSVFEPREIPRLAEFSPNGELYCEFKFAPFSCPERRGHQMDSEEKDLSGMLKTALEPAVCRHEFPNFQVDVYALVLDNDGSCLSAAITAAGLALVDAAIPMYDIVTSVTLGIQGDLTVVDPTLREEDLCKAVLDGGEMGLVTLSYMPAHAQITELVQTGFASVSRVLDAMGLLTGLAVDQSAVVRQTLAEGVRGRMQETDSEDQCIR